MTIIQGTSALCKCGKPAIMRKYKDGRKPTSMGACHECISLRSKGRKRNPISAEVRKAKKLFLKKHKLSESVSHPMIVTLDFAKYQEIYLKLKDKAHLEMRTIEAQIIYSLRTV